MIIVYTTFPNEEDARKLGAYLIEERLAACVNVFPGMVSIYRWQDNIETASEAAMIIKTRKSLKDRGFCCRGQPPSLFRPRVDYVRAQSSGCFL